MPMPMVCSCVFCSCSFISENSPETLPSTPVQKSTEIVKQPVPVYIPTPKHLLEARKANGSIKSDEPPISKRPRLEYVPKAISNNSTPIPTYVPSSVANTATDEYEPRNVCGKANDALPMNCDAGADSNGDDILGLLSELSSEQIPNNENQSNCMTIDTKTSSDTIGLDESKEPKSKENSQKSSSSSRHRHHSHKSSHSDRKSSSSSRSNSSTHKSSHNSSHKSRHGDKDKDKHSDKDKAKSRHSSKSSKDVKHKSSEHRSKSSSSSSSSRHHSSHHSDRKTHSSNNNSSSKPKDCVNNSIEYETDSEDDDVEAQCRMIFEEFDPSTVETKSEETPNGQSTSADEDGNDSSTRIDDPMKKKRVAHENADKQVNKMTQFRKHTDHVKNAMQVCQS